jgi:hypothetical protein
MLTSNEHTHFEEQRAILVSEHGRRKRRCRAKYPSFPAAACAAQAFARPDGGPLLLLLDARARCRVRERVTGRHQAVVRQIVMRGVRHSSTEAIQPLVSAADANESPSPQPVPYAGRGCNCAAAVHEGEGARLGEPVGHPQLAQNQHVQRSAQEPAKVSTTNMNDVGSRDKAE